MKAKNIKIATIEIVAVALAAVAILLLIHFIKPISADEPEIPELQVGKYYLNGDKNTNFYIEVFDDEQIVLQKEDLKKYFYDRAVAAIPDPYLSDWKSAEDFYNNSAQLMMDMYSEKAYYAVQYVIDKTFIKLNVKEPGDATTGGGPSYIYKNETTISFPNHGDFILVK